MDAVFAWAQKSGVFGVIFQMVAVSVAVAAIAVWTLGAFRALWSHTSPAFRQWVGAFLLPLLVVVVFGIVWALGLLSSPTAESIMTIWFVWYAIYRLIPEVIETREKDRKRDLVRKYPDLSIDPRTGELVKDPSRANWPSQE
jgi:hypothetical protein